MSAIDRIRVTVVYALAQHQWEVPVAVEAGASVQAAIDRSGLLEALPELRSRVLEVGIFHRRCSLDAQVRDGDLIEIYRPLQIDPKQARRLRAAAKDVRRRTPAGRP
ncbi:hypothetical protein SBBP1_490005 [Burkholderiales bacterium]|nr:hypothetical protein SBBP1_490005 [Burkholderiales bacterium]